MATKNDIEQHYDENESNFFELILGKNMSYTCASWEGQDSLDEAQNKKYEKILNFAGVNEDTRTILDLGCGWGTLMLNMVKSFPQLNEIHGITISPEQARYCRQTIHSKKIKVIEQDMFDYFDNFNSAQYDAATMIGALEHLASAKQYKNNTHIEQYRKFFMGVRKCVKGHLALQTIVALKGPNDLQGVEYKNAIRFQLFISKYIFPNSLTPRIDYIEKAIEGLYQIEKFEVGSYEYEKTITCWRDNLIYNKDIISVERYDMFLRYFDLCIEHFNSGYIGLARYSLKPSL